MKPLPHLKAGDDLSDFSAGKFNNLSGAVRKLWRMRFRLPGARQSNLGGTPTVSGSAPSGIAAETERACVLLEIMPNKTIRCQVVEYGSIPPVEAEYDLRDLEFFAYPAIGSRAAEYTSLLYLNAQGAPRTDPPVPGDPIVLAVRRKEFWRLPPPPVKAVGAKLFAVLDGDFPNTIQCQRVNELTLAYEGDPLPVLRPYHLRWSTMLQVGFNQAGCTYRLRVPPDPSYHGLIVRKTSVDTNIVINWRYVRGNLLWAKPIVKRPGILLGNQSTGAYPAGVGVDVEWEDENQNARMWGDVET